MKKWRRLLVFDKENQEFLLNNNPSALREMAERLLEATQREMWTDSDQYAESLQDLLLEMNSQQEGTE